MSEVIKEESVVVRVGCLAGPNLSKELIQQQPAATVVASPFQEVISLGKRLLLVLNKCDLRGEREVTRLQNLLLQRCGKRLAAEDLVAVSAAPRPGDAFTARTYSAAARGSCKPTGVGDRLCCIAADTGFDAATAAVSPCMT
mgnify:CR=1 FL=1